MALEKGNLPELAQFWLHGHSINWASLYGGAKQPRVALPSYPFAKVKYWAEAENGAEPSARAELHPLLHQNTSDLNGLRFSSQFSGKEFFFADHVVQGAKTLPGVAQLEMALRAAQAANGRAGKLRLKDVVWARPIVAGDQALDLHLALYQETEEEIGYEIYRDSADGEIVYGKGSLLPAGRESVLARHDLKALQAQCSQDRLSAEECYAAFDKTGLSYGPGHRGLLNILLGTDLALAQIRLPESVQAAFERFELHPSLLDACLQAAIGFQAGVNGGLAAMGLMLPFALDSLDVLAPCAPSMWALVRRSAGGSAGDAMQKFDIDLCDDEGVVCVRLSGFCMRAASAVAMAGGDAIRTALFQPEWKPQAAAGAQAPAFARHLVLLYGGVAADMAQIAARLPGAECLSGQNVADIAEAFEADACLLLARIQALGAQPGQHLIQAVIPADGAGQLWSGLGGMLRCASLENPRIAVQLISVEQGQDVALALAENIGSGAQQLRYQGGQRQVHGWSEMQSTDVNRPWKDRGVYLITGGAGGLGLIFAYDIAGSVRNATLILTGRSAISDAVQAQIRALEALGAVVQYRRLDVGDAQAVSQLVQSIPEEFESLDGIIHSAGVLRDSLIQRKTAQQVREVLRAKVAGLLNLDHASRDIVLDCFICFSSTSGALGNVGQADYAAANSFMDAYAYYRDGLAAQGQRHGRTLAINWPLWEEGGMQVDAATIQELRQRTGLRPLHSANGRAALAQALVSNAAQVLVAEGEITRFKASLSQPRKTVPARSEPAIAAGVQEKALRYFVRLLAGTLRRQADSIDPHAQMEAYGIDSILVVELTRKLEQVFGTLSKTLFFEYQTIAALAAYFVENHGETLAAQLGESLLLAAAPAAVASVEEAPASTVLASRRSGFARHAVFAAARAPAAKAAADIGDIAIIGLAGRYPQARNVEEFWANLSQGKDCIGEIPSERWDYKLYFDANRDANGKTYSKWGGFIDGVDLFDPLFFNISPREAERMDPQERLFLECVHAALEDAGYTRDTVGRQEQAGSDGNVGVFVGVMYSEYQLYGAQEQARGRNLAMLNSPASIANRISYFCNFNGPSMALDTMCSSSLTAIHLAVQSLQRGDCRVAVAGGVNVSVHPNKYLMLAQGKFISGKGRCESFGEGGEGYVPGEGVGALLLKPKAQAIADGDHIYGIVKATAINHGGKTNGYTVPNPNAQAKVIETALRGAGIDARNIGYIEAHGTGTSLGDPIEIAGLSKAFQSWTKDRQFCSIGSAKSNIGHCESAAGVAGVTKVLLQLKHQQLAPSLHSRSLNPNIDFGNTPFVVQQELAPWLRPVDQSQGVRRELPRVAGISSFGAGGANAHVVIEEYTDVRPVAALRGPAVVLLSARDDERLQEQVRQLLAALAQPGQIALADLAYTLQVGREAMDERLALLASSLDDLRSKLEAVLAGETQLEEVYRGQVKRTAEALGGLAGDDDMAAAVDAWIEKGKLGKLLDLWVKGLAFDWRRLYRDGGSVRPRRISLPTYPFARERYWVQTSTAVESGETGGEMRLHPLVQRNTSDLAGLRFSSRLSGGEFFLSQHVVNGNRVLPGVAQLEMARSAVALAAGSDCRITVSDVVWARPVIVGDEGLLLHIALYPEDDGAVRFEIYADAADGETPSFSQGLAIIEEPGEAQTETCDIQSIREQCQRAYLSAADFYPLCQRAGLEYGAAFQGIAELFLGEQQVLARIVLPEAARPEADYVWHPSVLDAALQATLAVQADAAGLPPLMLPFALEAVEQLAPCSANMWALVRYSTGSSASQRVPKLDIDLCDEDGQVCLRFHAFSLRAMAASQAGAAEDNTLPSEDKLLLAPVWNVVGETVADTVPAPDARPLIVGGTAAQQQAVAALYAQAQVLSLPAGAQAGVMEAALRAAGSFDHLLWIVEAGEDNDDEELIAAQEAGVIAGFRLVKALLAIGMADQALGWTVLTCQSQSVHACDAIAPAHASVHGFIASMAKEFRRWQVRLLDMQAGAAWPWRQIFSLPFSTAGDALAWRSGQWFRQQLQPVRMAAPARTEAVYRDGGVYVIIGGAGGIGQALSEHLIRNYQANVFWIGRRTLDGEIEQAIARLGAFGPAPSYISADATDLHAMEAAREAILARFPRINGVVHAAIALLDKSLAQMDEDRLRAGLAAKVDISVRMAQVFGKLPLDFMLFCSSLLSFIKAAGQSNYAAGCTFKDAYSLQLAKRLPYPVKTMNWGYWGSVGVVASQAYRKRMAQQGIGSIEPEEGMLAIDALMAAPLPQLGFLKVTAAMARGSMQDLIGANRVDIHQSGYASVAAALNDQNAVALPADASQLVEHRREMDRLSLAVLWGELRGIGMFATADSFGLDDAMAASAIRPGYTRWLAHSLQCLAQAGWLQQVANAWHVVAQGPAREQAWAEWEQRKHTWLNDANLRAQAVLVETMLRALPAMLNGRTAATSIMFPNSSMELVEGVYRGSPLADYYNDVLAASVLAFIAARLRQDPSARIRILEIGAGTGGTSARVLAKLKPYADNIDQYCYTDLSRAFLLHAEQQYGPHYPYLAYSLFDASKPLTGQSIEAGSYDLVIATNVLHATKDIRESLRNAKAALRGNGLLLLNELSSCELWAHLTFGMLDGWWLYEDETLRIPGCPSLAPAMWKTVLREEGYRHIMFPADAAHALGQQVVLAESDGVAPQRYVKPAPAPAAPAVRALTAAGGASVPVRAAVKPAPAVQSQPASSLRDGCVLRLKKLVGQVLKMPVEKIDGASNLDQYGIDSILVLELTNGLRAALADAGITSSLSTSLFFEHQSIDALADHFVQTEAAAMMRWTGLDAEAAPVAAVSASQAASRATSQPVRALSSSNGRRVRASLAWKGKASTKAVDLAGQFDVAIIGLSGRYPMAENVGQFWENLKEGRNCIGEIPAGRWDHSRYFDPAKDSPGKTYTKWGGFLNDIDCFDARFFHISPREAEAMSPQERLFLQEAYSSIEDAGYTPAGLSASRKVGVFVGAMNEHYGAGSRFWSIANRTSWLFNFQGPSMAVDTACSSSLTAVHLALESLRSGSSEVAVAGGVNLIVAPDQLVELAAMTMLSSGDKCKSFAADGDGFVDGEAVGAIVLKPLQRAIEDGDHIYGVIKGSAVNAGGKTNGYMVPNPNQQAQLVADALERAGVNARSISYLEAQGTGSSLGDPIEIAGLSKAFRNWTEDKQFCALGSAKSNVGHCESASGMVGISKVLMQMKHGTLVPSLHAAVLNPDIDFGNSPFALQRELAAWERPQVEIDGRRSEQPRIAGISSFGAGGANAHLIIEEFIAAPFDQASSGPALVVLSARTEGGLQQRVQRLLAAIAPERIEPQMTLANIAYTLQAGREAMEERLAILADSLDVLRRKLNAVADGESEVDGVYRGQAKKNKEAFSLFAGDEDMDSIVAAWFAKAKLDKLGELWSRGFALDWNALHAADGPSRPSRISLPTYPFARERHWKENAAVARPPIATAPAAVARMSKPVPLSATDLQGHIKGLLTASVSATLKVAEQDIDGDTQWSEYGFDSITLTSFCNSLNDEYGVGLAPTIFFEYPTLDGLAKFLAQERRPLFDTHVPEPAPVQHANPEPAPRLREETKEAVAIIGMSGQFPMAPDMDAFWRVLDEGRDCIGEIPGDRWDWKAIYGDPNLEENKCNNKWGGFIDGIADFDPLFFGISPKEAELMDPQQRLMMLHVWKALEDAGYAGSALSGSDTALFIGTIASGYADRVRRSGTAIEGYSSTGSVASVGPNRMSYFLDFHGPSEPVETACSSSLVALRRGVQAIQRGECGVAVVGGVNAIVNPDLHISFNKAGMLAEDGRCKTFSSAANGYVRGEGAGMLVLKRLGDAERDGDHIYGLVRGTAENHGGRANSLTAPNPKAQAAVVRMAYEDAGIDPRTVTYIEAHGTGTSLGDPVEINGLKAAFKHLYDTAGARVESHHCGLGSAKTNFGHLELAAGVVGVMKVLLQMRHKKLVRSLHSAELNPYIDLESSPFYVVQEAGEWTALRDADGREIPRRAGVSSFGFGGVNAHVVLEEYIAAPRLEHAPAGPVGLVLSARNKERLLEQARQLLDFVSSPQVQKDVALADLAYTLQAGREAMEERLAFVVASFGELCEKLAGFVHGTLQGHAILLGQAKRGKDSSPHGSDSSMDLDSLLGQWVNGRDVNWLPLYGGRKPHRVSLPTYPFAQERYWIDVGHGRQTGGSSAVLHPLVQQNCSNVSGLRFSSDFDGGEFFLADHVVRGERVLPGAAQLEMALHAGKLATGSSHGLRLRNVVWARPAIAGAGGLHLHIALRPAEGQALAFEVLDAGPSGEGAIFSQGLVEPAGASVAAAVHDIEALRAHCTRRRMDGAGCYAWFERMGLHYGPSFQGLGELLAGDESALARIELPPVVLDSLQDFTLHPALLDAVLQASAGLLGGAELMLPFALGSLDILQPPAGGMWVVVQRSRGCAAGDAVQKFDIDLCGDDGQACIHIREFSLRAAQGGGKRASVASTLLQPAWHAQPVLMESTGTAYAQHLVLLYGVAESDAAAIRSRLPDADCQLLPAGVDVAASFESAAHVLLERLQALGSETGASLIQLAVPGQGAFQTLSGLGAMLQTAQQENPRLIGQVIEFDQGQDLASVLLENRASVDRQIRYRDGERMIRGWHELATSGSAQWKDHGVYLISGGAGGLGLIFARDIASAASGVTLVLAGRSPMNDAIRASIRELEALGAVVQYRQLDAGDAEAVTQLVHGIQEEHEGLDGIIHSAGVIRDSFLLRKTPQQLREVLRAKVAGTVNLDQASRDIALDCFICFSSLSGVIGNIGQADYAAANAFMDSFAHYRNELVAQGKRHGRSLSINWPLWEAGGMQVDAATRQHLLEHFGMKPLNTADGSAGLAMALASGAPQVLLVNGDAERMNSILQGRPPQRTENQREKAMPISENLEEKASRYFVRLLSAALKLPVQRINPQAQMESYGIDSILVLDLTRALEKVFGSLPKTLFFEYQTIDALSGYFLQQHAAVLVPLLGEGRSAPVAVAPSHAAPANIGPRDSLRVPLAPTVSGKSDEIAIVGLAGRYPQARNIEEFWANLSQGRHCIGEIPADRWDHKLYFDADRNAAGKTYSKWGGFMDGVDLFDPLFFNISPREAERMDPQERLFLECVHATLEDAGYTRGNVAGEGEGEVGVFVGVMYEEYQLYGAQEQARGNNIGLFNSPASIANRISYYCNFSGPSMALDTMCSSSLTAIHLAVQSLQRGDCVVAVAGGVNVSIHPNKYLMLAEGKFVSAKGRCESFGEGGEGYVPGEGVGAVLLKPKAQAIADGDHIYGVIRATAVNHGGKTNGYTVPNPNAQAKVIEKALRSGGVDARDVSYIEAHGTGTSLGDPIEIAGLSKAFQNWTGDKQFCAIGSAKSNIGHCESAAGIAGVSKVLLQMKHRQLAPSLHSRSLNPNIDFAATPFVVQQELAAWPCVQKNGVELPRIAGISSFGAGGANAHVVIEEYIAPAMDRSVAGAPALVLLSARDKARLQEQVRLLLAAVASPADVDLADLAYTLQVGREALEERLALLVHSVDELRTKLQAIAADETWPEDVYQGQARRDEDAMGGLSGDDDMSSTVDAWLAKGKFGKLLELWVKGFAFDWRRLHAQAARKPHRISLPAYPFARERYWIETSAAMATGPMAAVLHPMVHANTSNLAVQRFSSYFNGNEFFLNDHKVHGHAILPGVAQLEMALFAAGKAATVQQAFRLRDVSWLRPASVDEKGLELHIALTPQDRNEIGFEIYSEGIEETVIYSDGVLALAEELDASHDLAALRALCSLHSLDQQQCYELFDRIGIQYGSSFRGVAEILLGEALAVARICAPKLAGAENFILHPGVLDAALQATAGLALVPEASMAMLPYMLGSLTILASCSGSMWAVVQRQAGAAGEAIQQFDIDLCDDEGKVCVRIAGLELRAAPTASKPEESSVPALEIPVAARDDLQEKTQRYLARLLSTVLQLPAEKIDVKSQLEAYGIDSVMVMDLTRSLEKVFGPLSTTLFYEYRSIVALSGYFLKKHGEVLRKLLDGQRAIAAPLIRAEATKASPATGRRFEAGRARNDEDIAIIGLAGRYPKARNIEEFWANLSQGKDCIGEIPAERWDHDLYFDADRNAAGKTYSKWGGFIDGVDSFDPLFFNISPREAELMDPQERLFLECVHATLEDAGYTRETVAGGKGKAGVFVGVMYGEYQLYGAQEQALGRQIAISSSPASIANRISYFCNFNGPSMAVDTMCSSSLTAIHLAVQSLRRGDCAVAVAGGVNVSVHPNKYLLLAQGKFISAKGRCESFGEGGEGYVPGEGVGALLLKSKAQAIVDGDHIYGVIKASAVNHGGKTNGYTVPNPGAQAEVIESALREARIDARSISYIEAHGTGTSLGDPIEIAGLSQAFEHWTQDKQFCAIGSAKSNIGHCESAAGIAGVTKVLLQLKHQKLVPSLHSHSLNPNIDFANTPFVVQQELADWPRPVAGTGVEQRELPRRAGVSSFGAGGANAHIVIEEYAVPSGEVAASGEPALIVLSARSEERLKEQVLQLLAAADGVALADLAYTLQVGREAMEARLALVVHSIAELREKLQAIVEGGGLPEGAYRGLVKRGPDALDVLASDDDMSAAIGAWIEKGKFGKLLDLWVKGLAFDWRQLYPRNAPPPRRISLPTYPFARERYWINAGAAGHAAAATLLHPLVHRNTSRLSVQRFSSRFSGTEFFLADHRIRGNAVLPGVAQLEMALFAAKEAMDEAQPLRLRNVVWSRPVQVGADGPDLHLALYPGEQGEIGFEIYSEDEEGSPSVYSEGTLAPATNLTASHELEALRAKCTLGRLSGEQCYGIFGQLGIQYGASFRGLKEVLTGERLALASISLPDGASLKGFALHPALLDTALQAAVGLVAAPGAALMLPYALGSLDIFAPCSSSMWAVVRRTGGKADDPVQHLEIDLCDQSGKVCLRFGQLELRAVPGASFQPLSAQAEDAASVLLLRPEWRLQAAVPAAAEIAFSRRLVLLCGIAQEEMAAAQQQLPSTDFHLIGGGGDLAEAFGKAAQELLQHLQALNAETANSLVQIVLATSGENQAMLGLVGMLRSAQLENPRINVQLIEVEAGQDWQQALLGNVDGGAQHVRYRGGKRMVQEWVELDAHRTASWKDHGVYLITGGAGGLGLIFARDIAASARNSTLILTGRSQPNEAVLAAKRELEALGAVVDYRQADVGNASDVQQLIDDIQQQQGRLTGIIHSAGVTRDSLLIRKTPEQLREVLHAKVAGTINLDRASSAIALDCMILFSSISGALGNVGQADYAAANAFMDAFAQRRNEQVLKGERHGRTLSLNWPLWEEGACSWTPQRAST
ncbi:SDR family NAD(P)-dependent oxidoreductase [Massilia sp. MB5]|nr:SDR family NAD(P)-dependent oxidoreductase [Massilia sp. MB5]UMR33393.1 SDR family NAD(P)-dependent oxidoreductase [Massilia sp. MB5]